MRRIAVLAVSPVIVLAILFWRMEGPTPLPENAPANVFSASRGMAVLRTLLAEQEPHPIGSAANARVRERVVARFRELGYEVTIQRRVGCNASNICGEVQNVIAKKPGGDARHAVVLASHYDSVPTGPGASDDGAGTATLLEIARAVRDERFANAVIFLITDGEEAGLLGAEAFAADPASLENVSVVLNVEYRGTSGPSMMFETSRSNRWLIAHYARASSRPVTSSLFYTVYDLLPNDTDVSVFKRAGKAAMNWGAVKNVVWYHTANDDLAHADPVTMQHHGDNMLATLRVLANADLARRSSDNAAYFDVLTFFLVWWPETWTLWIAIASLAVLLFTSRHTPARTITWGVLATFATLILANLSGFGISWLANLRSEGATWVAHPGSSIAAAWLIGITASLAMAALLRNRAAEEGLIRGNAIVWHAVAIALAVFLPGAAYLYLVPAIVMTICAATKLKETPTAAIASTVAAIVIFPLGLVLYDALGKPSLAVIPVCLALFATTVAPLIANRRTLLVTFVAALLCAIVAITLPAYTPERPRQMIVSYVDDPAQPSPVWATNVLLPQVQTAAKFGPANASLTPWTRFPVRYSAPAPRLPIPRVVATAQREGGIMRVQIRSQRNAGRVSLVYRTDPAAKVVRVNGVEPPTRADASSNPFGTGWNIVTFWGPSADIEIQTAGKLEAVVSDITFGLPAEGAAIAKARASANTNPVHDGDLTITRVRTSW